MVRRLTVAAGVALLVGVGCITAKGGVEKDDYIREYRYEDGVRCYYAYNPSRTGHSISCVVIR